MVSRFEFLQGVFFEVVKKMVNAVVNRTESNWRVSSLLPYSTLLPFFRLVFSRERNFVSSTLDRVFAWACAHGADAIVMPWSQVATNTVHETNVEVQTNTLKIRRSLTSSSQGLRLLAILVDFFIPGISSLLNSLPQTRAHCDCVTGYTLLGLSMRWISETKRQLCRKS